MVFRTFVVDALEHTLRAIVYCSHKIPEPTAEVTFGDAKVELPPPREGHIRGSVPFFEALLLSPLAPDSEGRPRFRHTKFSYVAFDDAAKKIIPKLPNFVLKPVVSTLQTASI